MRRVVKVRYDRFLHSHDFGKRMVDEKVEGVTQKR